MNTQSNTVPESPIESQVIAPMSPTRPLYWSVWRELWENRSIYIVPLIVAAVQVFGFAITTIGLADRRRAVLLLDAAHQRAAIEQPYDLVRDRSILFWKSLPVSDLTTVLSKATIPLVVLPLIAFAITVCVQLIMVLETGVVLIFHGMSPTSTWAAFPVFQNWVVLLYGLIAIALWHAPIYGWLLLVSGWARRATFLWAVLPLIAIQIFEKITLLVSTDRATPRSTRCHNSPQEDI